MLTKSGIYQIRNTVNGKVYVGSSQCLKIRWRQHRCELNSRKHGNRKLQRAWDKHGADAFVFEPLITCAKSMLTWYEQQFMDQMKPEYNLRPQAESNRGHKYTEAQKAYLQKRRLELGCTERMRASKLGTTRPEHEKEQIRQTMKQRAADPEWRRKIAERQLGIKRTIETRQKQSENKRQHYADPANRARASEILRGKKNIQRYTHDGETHTLTEWAEITGISAWALRQRVEAGWDVARMLTTTNQKELITYNGESKSLKDWAAEYGLKESTLAQRMKKWDMQTALTKPVRDWSNR